MADWRKVMFSDESTFRLLDEGISWPGGLKECQGMPPSTRSKQSNTLKA